ncbi:hypothetical protein V6N13_037777 [Hibiscus sabdariffa]|uniref:NAC domain-containing protein n=1 Tax=Hibiscus sabdariffa TaxID=183260 RepID=A0ABR2S422_9ROSI
MEGGFFSSLPAGYRFKPRDEELVDFYLKRKIYNRPLPPNIFRDVDLYNYDPYTLTAMNDNASSNGVLTEWYFFTPRDRKYPKGNRPTRSAGDGYWKPTGKPFSVVSKGKEVGSKRSLAFFRGKSPNGEKTDWIMHEYVLTNAPQRQRLSTQDMQLDDWVLCRVYRKQQRLKPEILVEGNSDVNKVKGNEGAIVVHSDFQYMGNVIPPDASNMLMPQQVLQYPVYFGSIPGQNPATSVEGNCDEKQEEANEGEILVHSDFQDQRNGIPPDPLNSLMPQQVLQYPASFGSMPGQNPAAYVCQETPMASMIPNYNQFQPQPLLSQQFINTDPSDVDFTADWFIDEDQMLGDDIQSEDLDVLVSQLTFSMPSHNENGDYMVGQNPANFGHQGVVSDQCNFIPTSAPMKSMPPYHQFQPHFQLQVPPMQQLPGANPINMNFATADQFQFRYRHTVQEEAGNGADAANGEVQVPVNGIPPLLQCR